MLHTMLPSGSSIWILDVDVDPLELHLENTASNEEEMQRGMCGAHILSYMSS